MDQYQNQAINILTNNCIDRLQLISNIQLKTNNNYKNYYKKKTSIFRQSTQDIEKNMTIKIIVEQI